MPSRTSQEIAAELYPKLLAVCPSYAERRKNPPPEPAYNMSDFTHLCWDFAAHAVDMLEAGRAAELAPAFEALAEFRRESTEAWMENGFAPVFERIFDEGKWRSVDVTPIGSVVGDDFQANWRKAEDPYYDDPTWPIDGFY
jgi:hypothetical protein